MFGMRYCLAIGIFLMLGSCELLQAQSGNADSLYNLAQQHAEDANYNRADELYEKSFQLFLHNGDTLDWAYANINYSKNLLDRGAVQKSLQHVLAVDEISISKLDSVSVITLYNRTGFLYRKLEKYLLSREYYLKALELSKQIQDSLGIARLNNNISYTYKGTGNLEKALSHQYKAKKIFERLKEWEQLSFVLNGIFLTHMELGLHTQAEPYIRESLEIREALGDPEQLDVAYHNMAWFFERQGRRDSAVIYYQKSLELSRQLNNPYDITQTLINIGGLHESSGDYENALAYYNEALETNYQTERPVSIADNLIRLARVAVQNNDFKNAETFYREALTWLDKPAAPRKLADLYLDLANLKILQKNYPEARKYLAKAGEISRDKDFGAQQFRSHNLQGRLYKKVGKLHQSLAEYRKAYDLYANQTANAKIGPAANLAKAYHEIGSDRAFIYAEEAFTLIDSIRTNVAGMAFRSGFFRKHAGFYNEVASWYITQKDQPEKAFELIEAAKARVLMDELVEAREKVYENLDQSTLIRKQQLAKQVDRLYSKIEQATSEQERKELRRELKDREFAYQSFLNEIQAKTGINDKIRHPKPVSLQQARSYLDPQTAFVEYAFADSSLIRLVITQNSLSAEVIDSVHAKPAQTYLTHQIKDFRQSVLSGQQLNEVRRLGQQLSQMVLPANFEEKYEDISSLVVIPAGPLSFLPFEALSHQDNYLIENYQLKYLPSVSIYPFIENPHRITEKELLAVAGSGFEEGESWDNERSQSSFSSLPSTLLEVDSIAVNFTQKEILKNNEVTEASLKSHDLGSFRFLHFATHANVDEQNPSRSGLLLSRKDEVESLFGEDGHLNSREITGLNLEADLVTLSACNTGMGKQVTGEGVLGLQRSFLSAGASSVMVSLWSVFDRSTSVFMSQFYQSMLAHKKEDYGYWNRGLDWIGMYEHPLIDYKTKAVRDAKLALIDHPYYNHPVHWAPFILIGK